MKRAVPPCFMHKMAITEAMGSGGLTLKVDISSAVAYGYASATLGATDSGGLTVITYTVTVPVKSNTGFGDANAIKVRLL